MSAKSSRGRRKFTSEFKAEAVAMVAASGCNVTKVARELNIHDSTLGNWVRQAREEANGAPTVEERAKILAEASTAGGSDGVASALVRRPGDTPPQHRHPADPCHHQLRNMGGILRALVTPTADPRQTRSHPPQLRSARQVRQI